MRDGSNRVKHERQGRKPHTYVLLQMQAGEDIGVGVEFAPVLDPACPKPAWEQGNHLHKAGVDMGRSAAFLVARLRRPLNNGANQPSQPVCT